MTRFCIRLLIGLWVAVLLAGVVVLEGASRE